MKAIKKQTKKEAKPELYKDLDFSKFNIILEDINRKLDAILNVLQRILNKF